MARLVLIVAGAASVLTGAWMFLSPGSFYDVVATFPPRNDHFVRDIGSFNVALGAAALYAAPRPAWHAPMLGVLTVQYGLHTVSHLIDIDGGEPEAIGVVNFVLLLVATLVIGAVALRARARPGTPSDSASEPRARA